MLFIASISQVLRPQITAYASMAAKMLDCVHTIDVAVAPGEERVLADFGGVGKSHYTQGT